jgi:hypothetical protein
LSPPEELVDCVSDDLLFDDDVGCGVADFAGLGDLVFGDSLRVGCGVAVGCARSAFSVAGVTARAFAVAVGEGVGLGEGDGVGVTVGFGEGVGDGLGVIAGMIRSTRAAGPAGSAGGMISESSRSGACCMTAARSA